MSHPRMIQSLHAKAGDATFFLRDVDLTISVLKMCKEQPGTILKWLKGDAQRRLYIPSMSVMEEALEKQGQLHFPDFRENLTAFLKQVPTREAQLSLLNRLGKIDYQERLIQHRSDLLETVRNAKMGAPEDFDRLLPPDSDEYVDSCEEALERLYELTQEEDLAVDADALRGSKICPFLFGTKELPWGMAVCAGDIMNIHDHRGEVTITDVDNLLEGVTEDYYEGAFYDLVDLDELHETVYIWSKKQSAGEADDFDLEGKLAEWNAKQRIVSCYPDMKTIVPLVPGISKEDAISWCQDRILEAEAELEALNAHLGTYQAPEPEAPSPQL